MSQYQLTGEPTIYNRTKEIVESEMQRQVEEEES